jgi:hypothetical protein
MDLYSFYILGFMLGRPAIETSYLLWRQMEWYWELKNLQADFIDLEKTYDKVSREVLWKVLPEKRVPPAYVQVIKYMCKWAMNGVRA